MKKILCLSFISFLFLNTAFGSSGNIEKNTQKPVINVVHPTDTEKKPIQGLVILGNNYAVDDDFVYVVNADRTGWVKISHADRVSFRVISGQFARDNDQIFLMGKTLEWADKDTFDIISPQHGYASDKNHVYWPRGIIQEADKQTFKIITSDYAMDVGHVFFQGKMIDANSWSFRVLDKGLYAVDETRVYYAGRILEDVSPDGFRVKGARGFAADGRVFFEGKLEEHNASDVDGKGVFSQIQQHIPSFTLSNSFSWAGVIGGLLIFFAVLFLFFTGRNEEETSLIAIILKIIVSSILGLIVYWIGTFFLTTQTAFIVAAVMSFFIFVTSYSIFGWFKSLLITILSLISFVFILACFLLLGKVVFDTVGDFFWFMAQDHILLLFVCVWSGLFIGTWLIVTQLRVRLFVALGQSIIATCVTIAIVSLLFWLSSVGTFTTIILFVCLYTILLWIMRFRDGERVFAETVRVVRVGLLLLVILSFIVWIIL